MREGSAHLHRESTTRRVKRDLVSKNGHDLVAVGGKSNNDKSTAGDQDPDGNGSLRRAWPAGGPDLVDYREGTNRVGDLFFRCKRAV